ncbi:uroporphyrinogen-III synthase [Hydrogenophaga soli]
MPPPVLKPRTPLPPVVVTRPAAEARVWASALARAGSVTTELPLIEFGPPSDLAALMHCREHWTEYTAVMWVSPQAIAAFDVASLMSKGKLPLDWHDFSAIEMSWVDGADARPLRDLGEPQGPRCWVPGPGSARALRVAGVPSVVIDQPRADAEQYDSEALWAVVSEQVRPGFRLLVVRGQSPSASPASSSVEGQGRDWLADQVRAKGGVVHACAAYARSCPRWAVADHVRANAALNADAVWLFSSSEAVAHLARLKPGQDWSGTRALATHPRIALALQTLGFGQVVRSRPSLAEVSSTLADMAPT